MLTIEKKNNHKLDTIIIAALFAGIVLAASWIMIMSDQAVRNSCGSLPLAEYISRTAPAKCVVMWEQGKL